MRFHFIAHKIHHKAEAMPNSIIDANNHPTDISLNLSHEQFSEILLEFLGRKETLKYEADTQFLLRHNDIEQFHHLIDQKIAKEKDIHVHHFSMQVEYNDGTTREVNGIEAVTKFNETRDVIPVSVTMLWNILVTFPNAQSVENQRIALSFLTDEESLRGFDFVPKGYYKGRIILLIQHTNQAWGIEILNLLKDKISQVTTKEQFLCVVSKRILRKPMHLLLVMSMLLFVVSILSLDHKLSLMSEKFDSQGIYNIFKDSVDNTDDKNLIMIMAVTKHNLSQYIDDKEMKNKLSNVFAEQNKLELFKICSTLAILSSPLLLIWYARTVIRYYLVGSYILLTRRAEKEHEQQIDNRSRMAFYSTSLFVFSVFCSVAASYIYSFLVS
jgi:hypothetical protein